MKRPCLLAGTSCPEFSPMLSLRHLAVNLFLDIREAFTEGAFPQVRQAR